MTVAISTTNHHQYLFFLPITTWLWEKLGAEVICFVPSNIELSDDLFNVVAKYSNARQYPFDCNDNKEATYAQCARLFAGTIADIPKDEIIVTSDIDMGVFKLPPYEYGFLTIFGSDLVPENQWPMCYASATKKDWQWITESYKKTYQQCLDEKFGLVECENMRGNYWAADQELLYNASKFIPTKLIKRAREGTQFASNRIDRDDAYFMDRLNPDVFDYHFHRPGYKDENFEKILSVISYFYPDCDLTWMREYQQQYKALI